jgi:formylglycine-generating enzyme required for sulfatase activity
MAQPKILRPRPPPRRRPPVLSPPGPPPTAPSADPAAAEHRRRGGWRQRALRGLSLLGLVTAALIGGRWWLAGGSWPPADWLGWDWLAPRLAQEAPALLESAPLKSALDQSAFMRAQAADTEAAYRAYLSHCADQGCGYQAEAEAQIKRLLETIHNQQQASLLEQKRIDLEAYSAALSAHTEDAYRTYLARCSAQRCDYRDDAQQRLDALLAKQRQAEERGLRERIAAEQSARATALEQQIEQLTTDLDQIAFAEAVKTDTEAAYEAYLSGCAGTGCWHRLDAERRLTELRERERRFAFEPEMVSLKGGCLQMSNPRATAGERAPRTLKVCVEPFKLARHEITFEQYDRFTRDSGRPPADDEGWGRGRRPVIHVSWQEASDYANWLSERTGRAYRLPTEAEWEYAARAGTETLHFWGDASDAACRYANVNDQTSMRENALSATHHGCTDGVAKTAPVGQFQPNPWGLYDMLGNVWEWTCSAYGGRFDGTEQRCAARDHPGFRVIRGGAWHSRPQSVTAAARTGVLPDNAYAGLGFRLAED